MALIHPLNGIETSYHVNIYIYYTEMRNTVFDSVSDSYLTKSLLRHRMQLSYYEDGSDDCGYVEKEEPLEQGEYP